ncbi:hypothetical protein TDB9533_00015 [Thalassocella blandensis]|nr:hypothetical protein TDB9533_00015 [Thalassocella blandensis]
MLKQLSAVTSRVTALLAPVYSLFPQSTQLKRALTAGVFSLSSLSAATHAGFHEDLAYYHAPIHYQDTDNTFYPGDYITAIDYDFDWISNNNWDHLSNGLWPATVYYSVVESCSHYFITYAFFHPRDWDDKAFQNEHENDLEGALFMVKKDGSNYGRMQAMITVFHNDFYAYTAPDSGIANGHEDIDGSISFSDYDGSARAKTAQEAKGHGLKAWPYIPDFKGESNRDGIIYYPTRGAGEYPSSGNDRMVKYELVDILEPNGFWSQQLNEANMPSQTFSTWGTFQGNNSGGCGSGWKNCSNNAAHTPWRWDDKDDGASYKGEFAMHPAQLFDHYFDNLGNYSHHYIDNRYLSDLRAAGFSASFTPQGFTENLNLDQMYASLNGQCSQ